MQLTDQEVKVTSEFRIWSICGCYIPLGRHLVYLPTLHWLSDSSNQWGKQTNNTNKPLSHFVIQVWDEDARCLVDGCSCPPVRLKEVQDLFTKIIRSTGWTLKTNNESQRRPCIQTDTRMALLVTFFHRLHLHLTGGSLA